MLQSSLRDGDMSIVAEYKFTDLYDFGIHSLYDLN
jgi:hypothetical protein